MKFNKEFNDLINSEGTILAVVESIAEDGDYPDRLYVKGSLKGEGFLYAKINTTALEMFFQGRISIGELFLLRCDEKYIIEKRGVQTTKYMFDENLSSLISKLEGFDKHFYMFDPSSRVKEPFASILHVVKRDYCGGLATYNPEN